jgi:hypothetical protein
VKLVWKVAEAPTGRYRSFERRGWPTAYFGKVDGWPAAFLSCADEYRPAQVRTGTHQPITVALCHHQHPDKGSSWKTFRLKAAAKTLDEAKKLVQEFYETHPEWLPTEERK